MLSTHQLHKNRERNKKMKRIMLTLPSIFLWFGSCCIATAQDTASSYQINADKQFIQDDRSTTGKFQPVTVDPSATSDVGPSPQSLANKSVAARRWTAARCK
jgi:hypothetical protein